METEKVVTFVYYLGYFMSIVFALLGTPMAFNMVSPNSWYGVRTASTLGDPNVWYSVNSVVGFALIFSGILSIALIYFFNHFVKFNMTNTIIFNSFIPIIVPIFIIAAAFIIK